MKKIRYESKSQQRGGFSACGAVCEVQSWHWKRSRCAGAALTRAYFLHSRFQDQERSSKIKLDEIDEVTAAAAMVAALVVVAAAVGNLGVRSALNRESGSAQWLHPWLRSTRVRCTADSKQQTADSRQQTASSRQQTGTQHTAHTSHTHTEMTHGHC